MRQVWIAWTIAASLGVLAGSAAGQSTFEDTAIKRLLGKDYDKAKVVAVQDKRIVTVQLKTRQVKTLVSLKSSAALLGTSRPCWSPDGTQVLYAHGGKAYIIPADGGSPHAIPNKVPGVQDAAWWQDPSTKALCVVYATAAGKPTVPKPPAPPPPPPGPATFLHKLKGGEQTKLADLACTGGLSLDGTHLGQAGAACLITDLKKKKFYRLNRGRQASEGSMSPDNTYRLLLLPAAGTTFAIRNRYDREVWRLPKPRTTGPWRGPRWSNHANFCTATVEVDAANVMVLVKISTKQSVVLRGFTGNWSRPQLWLPSPAGVATVRGPIDHLVLVRLGRYKAKVAKAKDYSPIIAELKRNPDPEAAKIVAALESYGKGLLSSARYAADALTAQKVYRDLAVRYSRHEIGLKARQTLVSGQFRTELAAAPQAVRFEELRKRLHTPPGKEVKANFYDEAYMARNRAVLVQMVKLVDQMRQMHGGTRAYERARHYANHYGLPRSTSEPGNQRLTVTATVIAISPVPQPEQILPAKDALVYVQYRVGHVAKGKYSARDLVAVHWAVRFGRPAPPAKFRVGQQHNLTLDLFGAHEELEKITASGSANVGNLPPYWAISAQVLR